jgi:hypothetical protein
MKEDILEQVVDEFLNLKGYFTLANIKYKPAPRPANIQPPTRSNIGLE